MNFNNDLQRIVNYFFRCLLHDRFLPKAGEHILLYNLIHNWREKKWFYAMPKTNISQLMAQARSEFASKREILSVIKFKSSHISKLKLRHINLNEFFNDDKIFRIASYE